MARKLERELKLRRLSVVQQIWRSCQIMESRPEQRKEKLVEAEGGSSSLC
jgi:hypothetical protein